MLVACSSTERSGPTASSPPELSTQLLGQARPARPLRGDAAYAAPTAQAQPLDPCGCREYLYQPVPRPCTWGYERLQRIIDFA